MDAILQDFSEPAVIEAIEANLAEVVRYWFETWDRVAFHDTPEMMWTISDIQFPMFNSVVRVQLDASNLADMITSAIDRCKAHNVGMLWWTGPGTRPHDLGTYLLSRGFSHAGTSAGMALDLEKLSETSNPPPGLEIIHVTDEADLTLWTQTCIDAFELPDITEALAGAIEAAGIHPDSPMRNFLAFLDGKPIATASLAFGAGVAGIYNVATLKDGRGRGVGTAITRFALDMAHSNGYRVAILHSTEMGFSVYSKIGFREYCKLEQYVWSASE